MIPILQASSSREGKQAGDDYNIIHKRHLCVNSDTFVAESRSPAPSAPRLSRDKGTGSLPR